MYRKMLWVLCFAAGLFLFSCREDITLEIPPYESKLAVFCVLQPDRTPLLFLNRSKPHFNYSDTNSETEYINDALVVITDITAGIKDTLKIETRPLTWGVNDSYQRTNGPYYAGKNRSQAGHRYLLEVWHKGNFLNAETIVPQPVNIKSICYTKSEYLFDGHRDVTFKLKFDDVAAEENAYIALYFGGGSYSDFEYTFDTRQDGEELTHTYIIPMAPQDTGYVAFMLENQTLQTAKYISGVYAQSQFISHFFTEPGILKHNINGGLGIFGAASTSTLKKYIFVK